MPLTCAVGNVLDECPHDTFGKLPGFCDGVLPFASPIAAPLFDPADPNQRACGCDELRSYPPIHRGRSTDSFSRNTSRNNRAYTENCKDRSGQCTARRIEWAAAKVDPKTSLRFEWWRLCSASFHSSGADCSSTCGEIDSTANCKRRCAFTLR